MAEPLGLSKAQTDEIKNILGALLQKKQSSKVYVFGSRAKGGFKKYSDLDLWIESSPELSAGEIETLRQQFEDSDLAIKVDIVTPAIVVQEYEPAIRQEMRPWL